MVQINPSYNSSPESPVDFSYSLIKPNVDEHDDDDDLFSTRIFTNELSTSFLDEHERDSVNEIGSLIFTLKFMMKNEPELKDLKTAIRFFDNEIKLICTTSKSLNGKLLDHFTTSRTITEQRYKDESDPRQRQKKQTFTPDLLEQQWVTK